MLLPGGYAERLGWPYGRYDQGQLRAGIRVEMEHTNDPRIAREIATDHLAEQVLRGGRQDYYTRLWRMEGEHGLGQVDFEKDIDIEELAQKQPVGLGFLAASALIGGAVIGALAFQSGWVEDFEIPEGQPVHEELLQFTAANVALIMGGYALKEAIVEMGRKEFFKTMGYYTAGLLAFKVVVDGVRWVRK